jgi:hypothetical protein
VVRRGDSLSSLAQRFGFDADEVWDHPRNAELRARRPNREIFCPGANSRYHACRAYAGWRWAEERLASLTGPMAQLDELRRGVAQAS